MGYFVIRQDRSKREKLFAQILEGRLRQGWSFTPGLSLRESEDKFAESYAAVGRASEEGRKRFSILKPMRFIVPDDIIVVPNQPDDRRFLIVVAAKNPNPAERYSYDFVDPLPDTNDYRNLIYIDKTRIKTLNFDGLAVPPIMKQKLKSIAYSSAVNVVNNRAFVEAILKCLQVDAKQNQEAAPLKDRISDIRKKTYQAWLEQVRTLTPSDFEKLVEAFMTSSGYHTERRNECDGQGKDVDLLCERTFSLEAPLGAESHTVQYRIQAKKHGGQTDAVAVRQLLGDADRAKEGIIRISVVISAAEDFTDECKQLAGEHDIRLMNGIEFARLYFQFVEGDKLGDQAAMP